MSASMPTRDPEPDDTEHPIRDGLILGAAFAIVIAFLWATKL